MTIPRESLPTPFATIWRPTLQRNIDRMQDRVGDLGATLRPHFKSHKSLEVADLQRSAGAAGFTCATPLEACALKEHGIASVFLAGLPQSDRAQLGRLAALADDQVAFSVDSEKACDLLARVAHHRRARALIEVDVGSERTGARPGDVGRLAQHCLRTGLEIVGLYSYPGQAYSPGAPPSVAKAEEAALERASEALARANVEVRVVSAGSTPTMPYYTGSVINEYRPGTYVFGDRQQVALGAMDISDVALSVTTTVVARNATHVVIDAGGKALGRDTRPWLEGHGEVRGLSGAVVRKLWDHHATINAAELDVPIGERVEIVPNNCNSAVNLLGLLAVTEADGMTADLSQVVARLGCE